MPEDNVQSDVAYFTEHEEARLILSDISSLCQRILCNNDEAGPLSQAAKELVLEELISKIDTISELVTKYMNVEVLLYQYIDSLIGDIFDIVKTFAELPRQAKEQVLRRSGPLKSTSLVVLENLCYYLYIISKCVGVRRLINHAPNDVSLFDKITETVEIIQVTNSEPGEAPITKYEDRLWCLEFIFLAWQSLLVYTPFELNTIWKHPYDPNITFQTRILTCSMYYLSKSTKARDGAAMVISNLFSRKDVLNSQDFHFFLNFCRDILTNPAYSGGPGGALVGGFLPLGDSSSEANNHLSIGVLMVLKQILKRLPSEDLRPYLEMLKFCLLNCDEVIVNSATRKLRAACLGRLAVHLLPPQEQSQKYRRRCIKIFEKGNHVSDRGPEVEDMDLDSGSEVPTPFDTESVEILLAKILESLADKDIRVRWACAKSVGRITSRLSIDLNEEILDHIIDMINLQFNRAPINLPPQTFGQTPSLDSNPNHVNGLNLAVSTLSVKSESVIHGGCLAIAEILRKGLIHPHMLDKVLDTTILSLSFEVWRGKGSAGTAVRDASCFICWAIARTFTKEMLSFDHVSRISRELVNVSLFDSSVNCRRAACSALQELLGRIGTVPKGLELIQICNYFTVSNRKSAFADVCQQVAALDYYSNSMLENVITTKLFHPDLSTRELASFAIYKILSSTKNPTLSYVNAYPEVPDTKDATTVEEKEGDPVQNLVNYLIDYFLSKLFTGCTATTHGSLRALARLISFVIERRLDSESFFANLLSVPVTFEKRRLFRGKGSMIIRQSICKLIAANCRLILHVSSENISRAARQLHSGLIDEYIVVLKDCLRNFALEVQLSAVEAFDQLFPLIMGSGKFKDLLTFFFNCIQSKGDHIAARRGYALVFSSVPIQLTDRFTYSGDSGSEDGEGLYRDNTPDKDMVNKMLAVLCSELKTNAKLAIVADAKTRQFALLSIFAIVSKLNGYTLERSVVEELVRTLVACCQDHEVDSRGDVGSWVRELSSEAIVYILQMYLFEDAHGLSACRNSFRNMDKDMATDLTRGLVSLALENLEHVRSRSTFLFAHLFTNKLAQFNFKWVWNRIFFNLPYEHLIFAGPALHAAVSAPGSPTERTPSTRASAEPDASDSLEGDLDREIAMYIDKKLEDTMYVKIDNKLLDGFNMLFDISKGLIAAVLKHFTYGVKGEEQEPEGASAHSARGLTASPSGESDSDVPEELLDYSLMGSEKINVVLRIPGWSAAPLTFKTLLWVLLIPAYSATAFRALVKILGQNMRIEVTMHSDQSVLVLEEVFVEFVSQNKYTLIGWNNEPRTLEQAMRDSCLGLYREACAAADFKTAFRTVNTFKVLLSHGLLQVSEWSEVVSLMISEARTATNYSYLKAIVRCLQVLLMTESAESPKAVLLTLVEMLNHQYPTIRSYVASHLGLALDSRDDDVEEAISILDSCAFPVESPEAVSSAIQRLKVALRL